MYVPVNHVETASVPVFFKRRGPCSLFFLQCPQRALRLLIRCFSSRRGCTPSSSPPSNQTQLSPKLEPNHKYSIGRGQNKRVYSHLTWRPTSCTTQPLIEINPNQMQLKEIAGAAAAMEANLNLPPRPRCYLLDARWPVFSGAHYYSPAHFSIYFFSAFSSEG